MALGPELIILQNNRDFSGGSIGNWLAVSDGTGTVLYEATQPGAEKVGAITSAGDETYLLAALAGSAIAAMTAGLHVITFKVYSPAANSDDNIACYVSWNGSNRKIGSTVSLTPNTWTTVTFRVYVSADIGDAENLQIANQNLTAGDVIYFDDISVRQVLGASLEMTMYMSM